MQVRVELIWVIALLVFLRMPDWTVGQDESVVSLPVLGALPPMTSDMCHFFPGNPSTVCASGLYGGIAPCNERIGAQYGWLV